MTGGPEDPRETPDAPSGDPAPPDEARPARVRRRAPFLWWVGAAVAIVIATAYRTCS